MISLEEVLLIHDEMIRSYGGLSGVRDLNILESAIHRPYTGIGSEEFYKTPSEKAAAILESIVGNHPFMDGNKRTGYVMMRLVLLEYGFDIEASKEEKYKFVISVASGQVQFPEILNWINSHLKR